MLEKIKQKLSERENKKIFSNFISLSFLQGSNLILPLITFPYLVRILGIEKYGLVMFAQAFMMYFSLIGDYGFNLSGTREVALYRNNFKKLTRTYNSILSARLGLIILGFIVMSIIVFSINKFSNDWKLYFLTYAMILGNTLFPIWFFQGMEKMKYITILSVVSKLIFTILIFLFVNSPDDYLMVPMLNALGSIFIGFIALFIVNKHFNIPLKIQQTKYVVQQLKKGWYIFISKVSTNLYTSTTTFILGLVTNNSMVGYYVVAEKVIRIITSLFTPFTQAIYPNIVKLAQKSRSETILLLRKILKYTFIIFLFIWIIAVCLAETLFNLVFGNDVNHSIIIFRILSPLIVVLPVAVILFNITLLSFKMDKYFFRIYTFGSVLNVLLLWVFLFILKISTIGAALSLLICEFSITIYAVVSLYKNNIKLFLPNDYNLNN